ncbi:MAG: carboxypeptidase regulatory-like domain-containing protein [Ignavibacteria bacterium]|nr:carboxypeptidase regulatory-like domain-containing protein [Ignavibacteria bacterium]
MKFLRLLCLLPALVILLATCKEAGAPTDANGNPTGNVTTTLAGIVVDESGQPVSGVAVITNGKNTVTDKYGTFMIQNASVPGNRCFIICKKNGYFTGSRAEVPKGGGITELRLTLQSSAPGYTVNSSTGGTLSIGTASVKFPPSAFVTSDGKPFTGAVYIAAKHLGPSQPSFYNSFSGDMTARRTDGTQTELLSYGVLRVRLTDEIGAELNLASGKTATLTYPITPSQQKTAPASMPLWYFDEALGMWKEEGVAVKSGDSYSGEVAHFTDWNLDVPAKTAKINGRVLCYNEGVMGIYVTVGERKVVTDSSGYFTCRVAVNTDFTISINPQENFGLFAAEVQVAALNANEEHDVIMQLTNCPAYITGVLRDCNDKPIAGTIAISFSGNYVTHFSSGEFKICVPAGVDFLVGATSYNGLLTQMQSVEKLNSGVKKILVSSLHAGMATAPDILI